jgi:hypothetical protein
MRFKVGSLALLLAVAVLAAGCGSKKTASNAAASSTTTTTATATTNPSSGGSGAGTASGGASTVNTHSFASVKNCEQLAGVGEKFSQAMAAASSKGTTNLTQVAAAYKSLAGEAPAAIRSDFETLATAFQNYAKTVQKAGYSPGKVPTASQIAALALASKSFSAPNLQHAEEDLTSWASKNCHG